jgi:hypothetical protein
MSRQNVRIVFSVLVSLAILAGVFSVVQGASLTAGTRGGQYFVDAGLMPDLSRARTAGKDVQNFAPYYYEGSGKGGGCERDSHLDPDD